MKNEEQKEETVIYKPYDVVTDKQGNVGFINEVNVNTSDKESTRMSYAVTWIVGKSGMSSWHTYSELKVHCNLFVKIAECSCHPFGRNVIHVQKLLNF